MADFRQQIPDEQVDSRGTLQIDGPGLQQIVTLLVEIHRQAVKQNRILSEVSGVTIDDSDIEPLIF